MVVPVEYPRRLTAKFAVSNFEPEVSQTDCRERRVGASSRTAGAESIGTLPTADGTVARRIVVTGQ